MPLKIIYLDDEPDLLEIFRDNFSSTELSIETFTDPKLAVEAIKKGKPDLVIIDFRLPNVTGDQVALGLDPKLPKILITGDLQVKTECEFVRVFNKPFDLREMKDFLEKKTWKAV